MTSSQRLSRNACHVHLSKHTTGSTDGNATERTQWACIITCPGHHKNNKDDGDDEDDEDDEADEYDENGEDEENDEDWLLSRITL